MKIVIPLKRTIDPFVKPRIKADHSGMDLANVKMAMNPFDEIAVEEAIRLKEQGIASQLIAVSIGDDKTQETLRQALALGVDEAIHVSHHTDLEPLNIAKILKAICDQQQPDLIIMGKQTIDNDNNQTGQMLAALLDWPQATFASACVIDGQSITVTREIDGGLERLKLSLPAVVTTDLRLNEPRYASLPNIMKAKKKPLESIPLESLNIELKPHLEILKVEPPPERNRGKILESVDELISALKNEAKVIE